MQARADAEADERHHRAGASDAAPAAAGGADNVLEPPSFLRDL
jgi:hypothetical protein